MRENYEKGEIVGKLGIEIVLSKKLYNNWIIIVLEQNENKIKTEQKQDGIRRSQEELQKLLWCHKL